YLGDIDFYLEQRKLENMRQVEEKTPEVSKSKKKNEGKLSYEQQKARKTLKNKISNLEAKITKLEGKIEEKDLALALNYEETAAKPEFFDRYQADKKKLNQWMEKWEVLQEKYDNQEW